MGRATGRLVRIDIWPSTFGDIIRITVSESVCTAVMFLVAISVAISVAVRRSIPIEPTVGTAIGISHLRVEAAAMVISRAVRIRVVHRHLGSCLLALVVLGVDCGDEVDKKAEDVERIDKGDDPFKYSSSVVVAFISHYSKGDCKCKLDDNEEKLNVEGETEDFVISEMGSEALIFDANKDCANNITSNEQTQENVMKAWMTEGVEDGEKN